MTETRERPPLLPGGHPGKRLDSSQTSRPGGAWQAQNRTPGAAPHLRLVVPPPPPSRPQHRRLAVRIGGADSRSPHGRSRAFRLTHDDLDELIATAARLQARA